MADEREIVLSERNDIENVNLHDYVPEALIKVYPYRAIFGRKDKNWLQSNTNTIVRISQFEEVGDDVGTIEEPKTSSISDFNNLDIDENNNYYFSAFVSVDAMTKETISPSSSSYEKDIRKIKQLTMLVNKYIDSDDDRPDFFTIKRPFNEQDFKDGKQTIYYGASFIKAYPKDVESLLEEGYDIDIEQDTVSEITLYDISELEKELDKSKLYFTQRNSLFKKPKITYKDANGNTVTKNGIKLTVDTQTLLETIDGKGLLEVKENGSNEPTIAVTDVDFKTAEKVIPFKMKPVNAIDKVTMAAEWFDYDKVMPYFIATQFENDGAKIQDLLINPDADKPKTEEEIKIKFDGDVWKNGQEITFNLTKNISGPNREDIFGLSINNKDDKSTLFSNSGRLMTKSEKDFINSLGTTISHDFVKTTGILKLKNTGLEQDMGSDEITFTVSYNLETDMEIILKQEDINLIEDILILSIAQHDSFNRAQVLQSGGDAGKIDPKYRLGHKGIKVQTIKGQNIATIIDGWFLEHQSKYPSFRRDKQRYQTVKSVTNALSRYITSQSNATAGGSNELNSIILPWFLELFSTTSDELTMDYSNKQVITNQDAVPVKGTDGTEEVTVESYMLPGVRYENNVIESNSDLIWKLRTNFYKQNYSSTIDYDSREGIELPDGVNLSNVKMYQTDRKVIFPRMESTLKTFDLNSLPGDIKGDDKDFSYMYHIPINNKDDFAKIFLDEKNSEQKYVKGDRLTIQVPRTQDGELESKEWAKKKILTKYPNVKFIQEPIAKEVNGIIGKILGRFGTNDGVLSAGDMSIWNAHQDIFWGKLASGEEFSLFPQNLRAGPYNKGTKYYADYTKPYYFKNNEQVQETIAKILGIQTNAISVLTDDLERLLWADESELAWTAGELDYSIKHTEFTEAIIEFTDDETVYNELNSFNVRQILFDKSEWTKFISQYTTSALDTVDYHLIESTNNEINILEELTISSIWGNEMILSADGIKGITIRLNNQDDETLTTQKIILY